MSQSVIGSLRVNLGLDSAQFQRGAKRLERPLDRMKRQFARVAATAATVSVALGGLTASVSATAREISRLSQVSNTTPVTFQRWASAAKTVGIEQEKLSDILKDTSDRVGDFLTTGGGPMADFFEKIAPQVGVTAEQFRNLSGPQALQLYVSSLEKANLSQAEMTFFLEAMASDATLLLPLLRNNGEEMGRLADRADQLGAVLDNKAVASLKAANLALEEAKTAIGGLGSQIGATFAPAMQRASEYIANAVSGLSMLVRALRDSGGAMAVLKDVALEVFDRIRISFSIVPAAIAAGSAKMRASFITAIGSMASKFVEFTWTVAEGLNGLFGSSLQGASANITQELNRAAIAAEDTASAATSAMNDLAAAASAPLESLQEFKEVLYGSEEAADGAAKSIDGLSAAAGAAEKATGGASKALANVTDDAEDAASEFNGNLKGAVTGVADAFAQWTVDGFSDFKTMTSSILDAFKNMLKNMIATAAANKIMIGLGLGGVAGGAMGGQGGGVLSSLLGGGASGGGLLGGVGGLAGLGSAFSGGMGMFTSGLMSGGLGGGATAISTALAGAGGGLGGLAAAAGAVALPIAAVVAAVSFFKKKSKTIDEGIRATVTIEDAMFESFKRVETSRFWGLSKKRKTKYKDLSDAQSDPLLQAVQGIQQGALAAVNSLGFSDEIFNAFSTRFKVSLRGLSESEQQEAITKAFQDLGNSMANVVPGLREYSLLNEASFDTLQRLSGSLLTVNDVFRDLGFNLYNVSLAGADGAAQFANLFGSLEGFTSASAAYYDQFYSDEEKLTNATGRLSEALADLGVNVMPATNDAFRALVDTAMLAGDSDLAAGLIQLAPAFDTVTDSAAALRAELLNVNEDAFATGLDYQRGLARAANGIEYTPGQADIVAKLDAMIAAQALAQSTAEITAANTGKAADNTEGQLFIAEESLL